MPDPARHDSIQTPSPAPARRPRSARGSARRTSAAPPAPQDASYADGHTTIDTVSLDEANAIGGPANEFGLDSRLLNGIVENAPDGIVVADATGRIRLVNRQAEVLFGYTRDELVGATLELLIPERFHGIHVQHRAYYHAHPYTRPMGINLELTGRRKDGSEFPVEISLAHLQTAAGPLVISSIRDVTRRKRLEAALHTVEEQARTTAEAQSHTLQTILEELPSGVCLVQGLDARLVLANRAVDELWGGHWAQGQSMSEFLVSNGIQVLTLTGQPQPIEHLAAMRAVRGEVVQQHQQIVRHPDGTTLPFFVNAVPLESAVLGGFVPLGASGRDESRRDESGHDESGHDESGRDESGHDESAHDEPAALVVYQDLTALKDAERLKDEFVALAAHELRNPMAAMKGFATMLQSEITRLPGESETAFAVETAQEIDRATDRLVALTDDLLDVTRLQAGRLELHAEPHDLVALARRVARRLEVTTQRHTLTIRSQAENLVVEIDVRRMEQVVTNLLNNAIKYSPQGGEVTLELREIQPGTAAELRVCDHGIGIPAAEQARIFARFARAQNARALGVSGTGLGLYLCRELVERHGGRIWFESTEGQGSTFAFTLPLAPENDAV